MHELPLLCTDGDGWIRRGVVSAVCADAIELKIPPLVPRAAVAIARDGGTPLYGEVIKVTRRGAVCAPLTNAQNVTPGMSAWSSLERVGAYAGTTLLGRVTDAWGRSDTALPPARVVAADPPRLDLRQRAAVTRQLITGIAAIDLLLPFGYGQRIALLAGAGVGKTTLLQKIVDSARADACVVALVGERGREAAELVARLKGGPSWSQTTIVCATSDAPAAERLAAARTATAHAESMAHSGMDVVLVIDSLTRFAAAWREIALAAGEAPAHRGFPPSLGPALARLIERAGARVRGSLTGVYGVLVDGDDPREPVADTVRALTDGHVVLSRKLADAGRFPAVDVLRSVSRLAAAVTAPPEQRDAATLRAALATLEEAQDLLAVGAYRPGADAALDAALAVRSDIETLLFGGEDRRPYGAFRSIAAQLRSFAAKHDA